MTFQSALGRIRSGGWEVDDYSCHIICANSSLSILGEDLIKHFAHWYMECIRLWHVLANLPSHLIGTFLISEAVPDTVTSRNYKLIIG